MFENIGEKIKVLAKIIFWTLASASIIVAIYLISEGWYDDLLVLTVLFGGPLVAWISSWFLYGFGELIDNTWEIALNTRGVKRKSESQARVDYERVRELEKLRSQELITEEEYKAQRAEIISKL